MLRDPMPNKKLNWGHQTFKCKSTCNLTEPDTVNDAKNKKNKKNKMI